MDIVEPIESFGTEDIKNYIIDQLGNNIFYDDGEKHRNIFLFKTSMLYDITNQQQNNEYNLAFGISNIRSVGQVGMSNHRENGVNYRKIQKQTFKRFDFHLYSCIMGEQQVMLMAEMVRDTLLSMPNKNNVDERIFMWYKDLENTNKSLITATFSATFISNDIFKVNNVEFVEDFKLENLVVLNK